MASNYAKFHRQTNGYRTKTANKFQRTIPPSTSSTFYEFMETIIAQLYALHKERTAETYIAALRSFKRFTGSSVIRPANITSSLILEYEFFLKARGVTMNTISFYMRILRAVYNRAIECGLTTQTFPFKNVYTGISQTAKRAIPLTAIQKIKALKLPPSSSIDLARNMFLFSFYTRGMAFIDMAYLKKQDLQNGILIYNRRKTGQRLFIKWEPCMQDIINKYPPNPTPHLLPIITKEENKRQQYQNSLRLVNNKLKIIADMINLSISLTLYATRHSWASIARSQNIPLAVISQGMGHRSENTTRIYLDTLDNTIIDNANSLILQQVTI